MRAQVHARSIDPAGPDGGPRQVARALLDSFPRQRPVTLAVLSLGPHAGLTPTPWVLDGVLAALVEAERTPVQFVTLGDHDTAEAALRKASPGASIDSEDLVERPDRDRVVQLGVPPQARPLSLPRGPIGSSLILCAPLCCVVPDPAAPRRTRGPLASTFASIAQAHGATGPAATRRPALLTGGTPRDELATARVGHELLAAAFASAAVILDGSWLALVGDDHAPARRPLLLSATRKPARASAPATLAALESPARVLGLPDLGRLPLDAALDFDAWFTRAIGLETPAPDTNPSFDNPPGRWPRPTLHPARNSSRAPQRLADRAIAGIRTQSARLRNQAETAALPAPVPGPLASLWTARWYGGDRARAALDRLGRPQRRRAVGQR